MEKKKIMKNKYLFMFMFILILLAGFTSACGTGQLGTSPFEVESYTSKKIITDKVNRRFELIDDGSFENFPLGFYSITFINEEWDEGEEGVVARLLLMEKLSGAYRKGQSCETYLELDENTVLIKHYVSTLNSDWTAICAEKTKTHSIWTATAVQNDDGGYTIFFEENLDFEVIHEYFLEK